MILGNPKRGARRTYSDSQRECHLVVLSTIRHGACFTVAPLTTAGFLFIFFFPHIHYIVRIIIESFLYS